MLTQSLMKKIAPDISQSLRDEYQKWLNYYCPRYEINNELRVSAFIANIMPETGRLTRLEENLNYSAKRLRQVWPSRFPTMAIANQYAKNPQKLANYVYGDRNGNRGKNTDDGWRYRGGGAMQTTGRANYLATGNRMGIDLVKNPELLRQPQYAIWSACVEFQRRGCNQMADRRQITAIRKAINGGTNGLAEAQVYYKMMLSWLPDDFAMTASGSVDLVKLTASVKAIGPEDVPDTAFGLDQGNPAWHDESDSNGLISDPDQEGQAMGPDPDSNASEGQQTPGIGGSESSVIVKDGDIQIKTKTDGPGPKEQVAIVEPQKKGFFKQMWAKVSGAIAGNGLVQWAQEQFGMIQTLGLSPRFWMWFSGIVGAGSLVWLISEAWKAKQQRDKEKELVALLAKENSTPDNQVHVISHTDAALYKAKGYKLIRAGEGLDMGAESAPAETPE